MTESRGKTSQIVDAAVGLEQGEPLPVFQIGYVSTQTRSMTAAELLDLLNKARRFNEAAGITGLLLHRQDSFFQVIEGDKEALMNLFNRIKGDPRHHRVEMLFEEGIEEREFADWRMGFLELDNIDLSLLPGYSNFLVSDEEPRKLLTDLSRSRRLLLMFRSMI